LAAFR